MSVALCSIVLNELEWLPALAKQHLDWPGMVRWSFVEFCDRAYATANPSMVSPAGLSVDGTSEFLADLAKRDPRVRYVPLGFTDHPDKALGKIEGKARALAEVADAEPEFFIILDADEFYTRADQARVVEWMRRYPDKHAFIFPRREIWRPPRLAMRPLFGLEVVGGFWQIPCCHWFRHSPGVMFRDCHNTPRRADGRFLNDWLHDFRPWHEAPQMIHLGFASSKATRLAKNAYYANRGEIVDRQRRWYVQSRQSWCRWRETDVLPRDAVVIEYGGSVPECFAEAARHDF